MPAWASTPLPEMFNLLNKGNPMNKLIVVCLSAIMLSCSGSRCYNRMFSSVDVIGYRYTLQNEASIQNLIDYNVSLLKAPEEINCAGELIEVDRKPCILTAAHCIYEEPETPKRTLMFEYGKTAGIARYMKHNSDLDLALYEVIDIPTRVILLVAPIASSSPKVDEHVRVIGSPRGDPDRLTHGHISFINGNDLEIDGNVWFGNSGGGVYNDKLELVGVLQRMHLPGNTGLACKVEAIKSFLEE